jgi:lysophospholipase L1-like esterase
VGRAPASRAPPEPVPGLRGPQLSIQRKIFLSALIFVGFFVTLELLLRLATTGSLYIFESNPHILDEFGSFELRPSNETWWYGFHYQVNAHGFRMPREIGPKRGVRVLGIGDSITEGMGVRDSEDTWPMQLERLASARGLAGIESINAGIQGWDLLRLTPEGLVAGPFNRFLEDSGPELDPDIVVWAICLNDTPSSVHRVFERDNARNRRRFQLFPERSREWFKRKAIYRLLRDVYRESRFQGLDYSSAPTPPASREL